MFIKPLKFVGKYLFNSKNFIFFNLGYNKNNMSTLENVIDGLNDVQYRIKTVVSKQKQVLIYFKFVYFFYLNVNYNYIFRIILNQD